MTTSDSILVYELCLNFDTVDFNHGIPCIYLVNGKTVGFAPATKNDFLESSSQHSFTFLVPIPGSKFRVFPPRKLLYYKKITIKTNESRFIFCSVLPSHMAGVEIQIFVNSRGN